MKILFILPEYYPHSGGGISTYYIHYIKALQPFCKKIKVIVGSGYHQADNNFKHDDIEVAYLKPALYESYLGKFTRFDLVPELKKNIAAAWAMYEQAGYGEDYDIIECTDFGFGYIPWVINNDKPVITRMHGSAGQINNHETGLTDELLIMLNQQSELTTLPLCNKLITYSLANQFFWNNIQSSRVTAIYPVFTSLHDPLPYNQRNEYGLVTARIQRWKGPVELCGAYDLLKNGKPLIKWFGRDTPYNEQQSTGDFLKSNYPLIWGKLVTPNPPLPNKEIKAMQKTARFGIVPSTWDMFNFTCVEFMAAGTPVICSDGAGASELIEHKKNGYKYPANDVQALAECLQEVNELDETAYNNLAKAGMETIKNELSAEKIIEQNLKQYESVRNNFAPNPANAFLDHIYKPSAKHYQIDTTFDKLPLKTLTGYVLKRIKHKYTGKK